MNTKKVQKITDCRRIQGCVELKLKTVWEGQEGWIL